MPRIDPKWSSPALESAWRMAPIEAARLGHPYLGVEHVLIALTRCLGGFTERLLESLELTPEVMREYLRRAAGGPRLAHQSDVLPLTPRLRRVLANAMERAAGEALDERSLLLAALGEDGGAFASLCDKRGWPREELLEAVAADKGTEATEFSEPPEPHVVIIAPQRPLFDVGRLGASGASGAAGGAAMPGRPSPRPSSSGAGAGSALGEFGRDLTAAARNGELAEAYGRQDLLVALARVLAHDFTNNPVLVGEAGVGKTAIVEGFAWRLAQDRPIHPEYHLDKARIIEVSITRLTAGTEYRGAFEERLQRVIDEASADPNVILFFDELHTLIGAGRANSSPLDAAQILKPALARGALRCIGATTSSEYDRYIAGDEALARRFERIDVPEPSEDLTLEMLRRWRPDYQKRYGAALTDEALVAAVRLSIRYLPARHLPEKAFKVLDNARVIAAVGGVQLSMNMDEGAGGGVTTAGTIVTPDHIAQAITSMTGIPVSAEQASQNAVLDLLRTLEARVKGQTVALQRVTTTVQSGFAGLHDPDRPRAIMLFLGPTGVGKTETARTVADALFGQERFLQIDLTEFSEAHSKARLIGSPPGYVGHETGGQLTSWLQNHPHSLVLLDEVDKAHRDVLDLLLQLFSSGRITDGRSRVVSGREAIFIMTANPPVREGLTSGPLGFNLRGGGISEEQQALDAVRGSLRAELLGRVDEIIYFRSLSRETLDEIVNLRLGELAERVLSGNGCTVSFTRDVRAFILQQRGSPQAGARDIAATIRRLITPALSRKLLELPRGSAVSLQVGMDHGRVDVRKV